MEKEIWRPVPGLEGYYEVSNYGKVRSINRLIIRNGRESYLVCRELTGSITKSGYMQYNLYVNSKCTHVYAHKAVASAFIPNPEGKQYVDHIDTNKSNNHVSNLRWCTARENSNNQLTLKHISESFTPTVVRKIMKTRRERMVKTMEKEVHRFSLNGEYIDSFISAAEAGRILGIHAESIRNVLYKRFKSAGGYQWTDDKNACVGIYNCRENPAKAVYQYDLDWNYISKWDSIAEAKRATGCKGISQCARGIYKSSGGFRWSYNKKEVGNK